MAKCTWCGVELGKGGVLFESGALFCMEDLPKVNLLFGRCPECLAVIEVGNLCVRKDGRLCCYSCAVEGGIEAFHVISDRGYAIYVSHQRETRTVAYEDNEEKCTLCGIDVDDPTFYNTGQFCSECAALAEKVDTVPCILCGEQSMRGDLWLTSDCIVYCSDCAPREVVPMLSKAGTSTIEWLASARKNIEKERPVVVECERLRPCNMCGREFPETSLFYSGAVQKWFCSECQSKTLQKLREDVDRAPKCIQCGQAIIKKNGTLYFQFLPQDSKGPYCGECWWMANRRISELLKEHAKEFTMKCELCEKKCKGAQAGVTVLDTEAHLTCPQCHGRLYKYGIGQMLANNAAGLFVGGLILGRIFSK